MDVIATASVRRAAVRARAHIRRSRVQDARRLYSLAFSILRDAGEAEDAVQETQLKAWRSWKLVSRMERPACVAHAGLRQPLHQQAPASALARLAAARTDRRIVASGRRRRERGPRRRRSRVPAALAQAARGDHAQLPARLLGRGVRRLHGVPARDRAHARRTRTCHVAKGAWRCLTSIPDWTPGCVPSSSTSRRERCRRGLTVIRGACMVARAADRSISSPAVGSEVAVIAAASSSSESELADHGTRHRTLAGSGPPTLGCAWPQHPRRARSLPHCRDLSDRGPAGARASGSACAAVRSRPTGIHLQRAFLRWERPFERAVTNQSEPGSSTVTRLW